jgi:hypothetical protein
VTVCPASSTGTPKRGGYLRQYTGNNEAVGLPTANMPLAHARLLAIARAERTLVPSRRLLELWYRTVH